MRMCVYVCVCVKMRVFVYAIVRVCVCVCTRHVYVCGVCVSAQMCYVLRGLLTQFGISDGADLDESLIVPWRDNTKFKRGGGRERADARARSDWGRKRLHAETTIERAWENKRGDSANSVVVMCARGEGGETHPYVLQCIVRVLQRQTHLYLTVAPLPRQKQRQSPHHVQFVGSISCATAPCACIQMYMHIYVHTSVCNVPTAYPGPLHRMRSCMCTIHRNCIEYYGVATISRLLKIIRFFCQRAL